MINLGAPLLWKNDDKLYTIGVAILTGKGCMGTGINIAKPVFNYIGWILEHVEGEVCGTEDKIYDWFDEQDKKDEVKIGQSRSIDS